jgi:excisionase family DNA binding protein
MVGTLFKETDMTERLLKEQEVSEALNVTVACLRRWRFENRGLPFVRIGGRLVRYRQEDVRQFVSRNTQEIKQQASQRDKATKSKSSLQELADDTQ